MSNGQISPRVQEVLNKIKLAADRRIYRAKDFITLYPKQSEFCDLGGFKRERLFMAGNQVGKSTVGAYETACHLTGEYPADWMGKTWDRPVIGWAAGVTGLSTRDIIQAKLCGEPEIESQFGTGMIPREAFIGKPSLARGVTGLYDTIVVRHKSGGESVLVLKSYEQGRAKWQGKTLDFVWFDEEPPPEIYSEGIARLRGDGIAYMTFTPLEGMSDVVLSFIEDDGTGGNVRMRKVDDKGVPITNKGLVMMALDDVTHFTEEQKQERLAGYPAHEREARRRGVPMLGGGRIFQVPEELIAETGLSLQAIPPHWVWLWGIDFGIAHPFAAVLGAWDRDADVIHILHTVRMSNAMIHQHVAAMKNFGWIPVAWPQDGTQRDARDLEPLANQYKKAGLRMLSGHATFTDGSNSTEAGIAEMDERFKTGKLKVARPLGDWWEEFRLYHRKDGLIVKVRDDLMSATRVLVMAKRHAAQWKHKPKAGDGSNKARGADDLPWQ